MKTTIEVYASGERHTDGSPVILKTYGPFFPRTLKGLRDRYCDCLTEEDRRLRGSTLTVTTSDGQERLIDCFRLADMILNGYGRHKLDDETAKKLEVRKEA